MRCLNCNHEGLDAATAVVCPKCGVHLPSLMRDMLPSGAALHGGKYVVEHALGQGGFGITYLARHATLKKPVAIKEFYPQEQVVREATTGEIVLRSAGRDDYERALRRFMREGETLAALDHPGVVRVSDQFEEHGTAYLVMDLVDGRTLKEELDAAPGRRLPEPRVRELAGQLVSALEAVHARGVCHLDIKPDNVLLRRGGRAVLIDFGASKRGLATRSTRAFTLEYAAPEVLSGEGVGPRSDLFELGMLLYEALAGERPPNALSRLTNDTWTPDKAPAAWRPLLASALRLRHDERPASVRAWWGRGPAAAESAPKPKPKPSPPPPKPAPAPAPTVTVRSAPEAPAKTFTPLTPVQRRPWLRKSAFVILAVIPLSVLGIAFAELYQKMRRTPVDVRVNTPPVAAPVRWQGTLDPRRAWQDTGVRVERGETLTVRASGRVTWDAKANGGTSGPEGYASASRVPNPSDFPVQYLGMGALVMKIGDSVYPIGAQATVKVNEAGTIRFMVNDRMSGLADNTGSFTITVQ